MFSTAFLTEPSRWLTEDSRNIGQIMFEKLLVINFLIKLLAQTQLFKFISHWWSARISVRASATVSWFSEVPLP